MSPSWRERVRIALTPHQVAMVRFSRGLRSRVIDRRCIPCPPAGEKANWAAAVEGLHELLARSNVDKGDAILILSSHFSRYLVLPWSAQLVTQSEELEFARARFVQVYGQAAHDWSIVMSPERAGAGRLCAAVDQALLVAAGSAVAASTLRLTSVQPVLMMVFNEWRRRIGDDGWLLIVEQGRMLIARVSGGQWRSVRARPLNGASVPLAPLLEQERLLLSAADGQRVFLANLGEVAVDTDGLKVEELSPAALHTGLPGSDAGLALAMCGA